MYYVTLHGIDSVTERRVGWGEGEGMWTQSQQGYTSIESIKSQGGQLGNIQKGMLMLWCKLAHSQY